MHLMAPARLGCDDLQVRRLNTAAEEVEISRRMYQIVGAVIVSSLLVISAGCSLQRSPMTNMADLSKVAFSNAKTMKESEACGTYILGFI
jgi:hypothetical protein